MPTAMTREPAREISRNSPLSRPGNAGEGVSRRPGKTSAEPWANTEFVANNTSEHKNNAAASPMANRCLKLRDVCSNAEFPTPKRINQNRQSRNLLLFANGLACNRIEMKTATTVGHSFILAALRQISRQSTEISGYFGGFSDPSGIFEPEKQKSASWRFFAEQSHVLSAGLRHDWLYQIVDVTGHDVDAMHFNLRDKAVDQTLRIREQLGIADQTKLDLTAVA